MPAIKEKESDYTSIRVDRDTYTRLKVLAGGSTLAGYLRQISNELAEIPPIEKDIATIKLTLEDIKNGYPAPGYRKSSNGEMVPIIPMREPDGSLIPVMYSCMIQDALEKDPKCREVGWYRLNRKGQWCFDQEAWDEWEKEDDIDHEAMYVAWEYLDADASKLDEFKKSLPKTGDSMTDIANEREAIIELGRKLMVEKKKDDEGEV